MDALAGKRVVQMAAGMDHTAVLTIDGEAFTFGCGLDGRLGHGGQGVERVPRRVEALVGKHAVRVVAGAEHTAVLAIDA